MGRIKNIIIYPYQQPVKLSDYLIGTDSTTGKTKNFLVERLVELVASFVGLPTELTQLTYVGDVTQEDGVVNISQVDWTISGDSFSVLDYSVTIPQASTNFYRVDIIVATPSGSIIRVAGTESEVNAVQPATPNGSLLVLSISVFGDQVNAGTPSYNDFMLVDNESQYLYYGSGDVHYLLWNKHNAYRWQSSSGGDLTLHSLGSNKSNTQYIYDGRMFYLVNDNSINLTVKHLSILDEYNNYIPFYMSNEKDLIVPPRYIAVYKYSRLRNNMEFVSLSQIIEEVTAADVSYDNSSYPDLTDVKAALDYLLYVAPAITSFTNNVGTAEIGSTVSSVVLNWVKNKVMTTQSINFGIGSISPTVNTYTHNTSITSSRVYTLTVGDGTGTATATTSITFMNRRFWGISPNTELTNSQVLALNGELSTARTQTRVMSGGGQYPYFCFPTSYGTPSFKVNGLDFTAVTIVTQNVTNASGYTEPYYVCRFNTIQNGTLTIQVL